MDITQFFVALSMLFSEPSAAQQHSPNSYGPNNIGKAILECYHPTGRFQAAWVSEVPWAGASSVGAQKSALYSISWSGGFVGRSYQMEAALVERNDFIKAIVVKDNAVFPPNPECGLNNWNPRK